VLALGVVNVILATVALSVGISGLSPQPSTAGQPTPAIAVVPPTPVPVATPGGQNPTPTATEPTSSSTPGGPAPSTQPSGEPAPTEPSTQPSAEPSLAPVASPAIPAASLAPRFIARPIRPAPATPAPAPTPAPPTAVKPSPTPGGAVVGAPDRPRCPAQASKATKASAAVDHEPDMSGSKGRACGHDKDAHPKKAPKAHGPKSEAPRKDAPKHVRRASKTDDHDKGHQPVTVDKPRREPKAGHRLRSGRRAR
jgi:hypothetical protein